MSTDVLTQRLAAATGLSDEAASFVALCIGLFKYCPEEERERATKCIAAAAYQLTHPGTNNIEVIVVEVDR